MFRFRRSLTCLSPIIVTSISLGHLYQVTEDGNVTVYAVTGGSPNGATEGSDGSIYVAQSPRVRRGSISGSVQRIHPPVETTSPSTTPYTTGNLVEDVTLDVVSPNDLCFGPDGTLWVTDPTRRPARDDSRIWKVDVTAREAQLAISTDYYANGIAFGREDDALYVVSTGERQILRYPIVGDRLVKPEVVVQLAAGHPDGFAFDTEGNLAIAVNGEDGAQGNIQVWSGNGELLEIIEPCRGQWFTNLAISADRRLIVAHPDRGAVLQTEWPSAGLPLFPFRGSEVSE